MRAFTAVEHTRARGRMGGALRGRAVMIGCTATVSRLAALHVPLHGPTAACHELHAAPGSFAAAMEALRGARTQGRPVIVSSWITRSTCRSLVALADRLAGLGVAGWALCWPRVRMQGMPRGPGEEPAVAPVVHRTVPRLGIAVPHALRAVARATERGLAVAVVGVPCCVLGPYAAHAAVHAAVHAQARAEADAHPDNGRARGVYPAVCEGCPSRAGCDGVEPWYLARFGARELRPVPAVPRMSWAEGRLPSLVAAADELGAIA